MTAALVKISSEISGESEAPDAAKQSFKAEYLGSAAEEFHDYMLKCWGVYAAKPNVYLAPYTTIVQSSGFGKSRLVRHLAEMTKPGDYTDMKVMCSSPKTAVARLSRGHETPQVFVHCFRLRHAALGHHR